MERLRFCLAWPLGGRTVQRYGAIRKWQRSKEGGANRSVSMVTGSLRCHSGARGRSLAGPSAMLRLGGANQRDMPNKEDQSEEGAEVV
ncbi:hypothetical protein INR49_004598 [Caranx melampygus]|nr:hypothetical protein INR49_004598 [Caranx melampygus]